MRGISLLLVPALAPHLAPVLAYPPAVTEREADASGKASLPYLTVVGAPALRFQESIPPPDLVTRPAAAAPPVPPLSPTEATVALANAAAVQPPRRATRESDEAPVTDIKPDAAASPPPPKTVPKAILPDDTRPSVRPEDFLPYFQLPGSARSANEVNVIVPPSSLTAPAPAPIAPSSATYTQTPK